MKRLKKGQCNSEISTVSINHVAFHKRQVNQTKNIVKYEEEDENINQEDSKDEVNCATEDMCVICGEFETNSELWIKCILCSEWAHKKVTWNEDLSCICDFFHPTYPCG
ncbi:hypothetical protein QE152_g24416 [Popillia japonica]|uniref:Uncharacterized protein n=1 Tax=Popillia japonica TaxID=7064 RepID=A0AAW1KFE9_POPJA